MSSKTVLLIGGFADGLFVNVVECQPTIKMSNTRPVRFGVSLWQSEAERQARAWTEEAIYTRRETIVDRERVTAIYALESMSEADMFRALIAGYRRG